MVGKGEKSRRVKITSDATQLLDKYIASRKISMKPDAHIFPSQRNEHLSVAAIEGIYEKYTQKAKAEHPDLFCRGPYTPHVMRHTTATHLIESGVPLAIVKNILGHTSIQTTQIYLDISQQTVDRSMEQWNEKWFSKHNPDETALPQEKNGIPDFLKSIEDHDIDVKLKNAIKFLKEGNKVKATIRFRGRQITHSEIGRQVMTEFAERIKEYGTVDKAPQIEGRNMSMSISPKDAN